MLLKFLTNSNSDIQNGLILKQWRYDGAVIFALALCVFHLVLPEWAFGRDSWIHYEPRSILSTHSTQIQLMVRTRIFHGTLLSLASADGNGYIRLEVSNPKAILFQCS